MKTNKSNIVRTCAWLSTLLLVVFSITLLSGIVMILLRLDIMMASAESIWRKIHLFSSLLMVTVTLLHFWTNRGMYVNEVKKTFG